MKQSHKFSLSVVTSILIGATGGWAIHAQQVQTPPTYLISEAESITDLAAVKNYGAKIGDTLTPFSGRYHFIVAGGQAQSLDGDAPPQGIVVIAFDSAEQARAWYNSPAYQAIRPLRQGAVKGRMFIVEGMAPQ